MKYKVAPFFDSDYPITQEYGERVDYYKQFGLTLGHEGVDYGTPNGTPVLAPFDGVVLRDSYADKSYGDFAVIWDPIQKCAMWFCHLQDLSTNLGDSVKRGQLLGHTNNTGNSSGPHCHINFVETDDQGNRLNKDNGNQGFLNLLAEADITNGIITSDPQMNDQTIIPAFLLNSPRFPLTADAEVQQIRGWLGDGYSFKKDLDNTRVELNRVKGDLTNYALANDQQRGMLDSYSREIASLKSQVATLEASSKPDGGDNILTKLVQFVVRAVQGTPPKA